jgi:hypothetical protein
MQSLRLAYGLIAAQKLQGRRSQVPHPAVESGKVRRENEFTENLS